MLELKNIIEDIVIDLINNLEESKSGEINKNQKLELASYVLNRIKPMYITSNRGFANIIIKYNNDPQFLADILIRISEGLQIVRKTNIAGYTGKALNEHSPYYFLPKIYGRIIAMQNMMPAQNATVTLSVSGKSAESFFDDWENPLNINRFDEGFYSFAPMPIEAKPPYESRRFDLKISVDMVGHLHERFLTYDTSPRFIEGLEIDFNENILQVEDIYIG